MYVFQLVRGLRKQHSPRKVIYASAQKTVYLSLLVCCLPPSCRRIYIFPGAGAAGLLAAQTLRQDGFKGRVVMITKEACNIFFLQDLIVNRMTFHMTELC